MSSVFNAMIPTNKTRVPAKWIRILYQARWFIFAFYFLATCGCIYPAILLSGSVSQDMSAPAGTQSAEALRVFEHYFPASAQVTGIIVYLRNMASTQTILDAYRADFEVGHLEYYKSSTSNTTTHQPSAEEYKSTYNNNFTISKATYANTVLDDRYNTMDFNLEYFCRQEMRPDAPSGGNILSSEYLARNPTPTQFYSEILYSLAPRGPSVNVFDAKHNFSLFNSYSSYRAVSFAQLPTEVGAQYTSVPINEAVNVEPPQEKRQSDRGHSSVSIPITIQHSSYIIISLKPSANDARVTDFTKKLEDDIMPALLRLHRLEGILEFTVISAPSFFAVIGSSVGEDITRMTTVVIPIAFVIFALALSSGRLALLPLAVFVSSLVISMAIMYGVASSGKMGVNSLSPGIIIMFTTALTMDFTFFIASQWKRVIIEQVRELLTFGTLFPEEGENSRNSRHSANIRQRRGRRQQQQNNTGASSPTSLADRSMKTFINNTSSLVAADPNETPSNSLAVGFGSGNFEAEASATEDDEVGGAGTLEGGETAMLANNTASLADFNQLIARRRQILGPKDELGAPIMIKKEKEAAKEAQQRKKKGTGDHNNAAGNDDDYVGFTEDKSAAADTEDAASRGHDAAASQLTNSALFKYTAKDHFKRWNRSASGGGGLGSIGGVDVCYEIDRVEVMKRVFSAAGKTLIVATVAILLSALGICAFSVDLIASIGVTVVVCTFVTGVTSAILPAALLLAFHGFFFGTLERWCNVIRPENVTTPLQQRIRTDTRDDQNQMAETLLGGADLLRPPSASDAARNGGNGTGGHAEGRSAIGESADNKSNSTTKNNNKNSEALSMAQQAYYDGAEAELALLRQVAETSTSNTKRRAASYRRFVRFIISGPQSVFIALISVGVLLTFAVVGATRDSYVYSSNVKQFIPANSPIVGGWDAFQQDFPPGQLFAYNLLQEYPSIMNFTSPDFFAQQHFAVRTIVERLPQTKYTNLEGSAFSGVLSKSLLSASGGNISLAEVGMCLYMSQQGYPLTPLCSYQLLLLNLFASTTAVSPAITYLNIALDFDPTEQHPGSDWYQKFVNEVMPYLERTMPFVTVMTSSPAEAEEQSDRFLASAGVTDKTNRRAVAAALPSYMRVQLHLRGAPGETFDTVTYATEALTTIISVAVPVIFVVVFLAFGSLVIALRIITTVALTVASVFSITALVYTNDALHWLDVSSVRGHGSMMWQMPFIVLLLSASVVLNYELIGTAKIVDFRWKNLDGRGSTASAVETGFSIVGREVSIAGIMMMVVFFGFLLSQVSALNQIGFVLFLTAFFSAFWVRLFVTPTLMGLLGEANWFPLTILPEKFRPPPPTPYAPLAQIGSGEARQKGVVDSSGFEADEIDALHTSAVRLSVDANTSKSADNNNNQSSKLRSSVSTSTTTTNARRETDTESMMSEMVSVRRHHDDEDDEAEDGYNSSSSYNNTVSSSAHVSPQRAGGGGNPNQYGSGSGAPSSPNSKQQQRTASSPNSPQRAGAKFAVNAINEVVVVNDGDSSSASLARDDEENCPVVLNLNKDGISVTIDQTFEDM